MMMDLTNDMDSSHHASIYYISEIVLIGGKTFIIDLEMIQQPF